MTTRGATPLAPRRGHDQASALRALVAQHQRGVAGATQPDAVRRAPVVAVTSGKGGVGKTSLCVNVCIALARSGLRATLVDADLGMANADVMCGLTPAHRLERVVGLAGPASNAQDRARAALRQIAIDAPGGFRLVPGSVGIAHMAGLMAEDRAALVGALGELDRDSDIVFIDTGAGVSPGVMSFVQAADLVAVVVTPEPTSIADAYGMIKCLRRGPAGAGARALDIALVVNQALGAAEAVAVHARIAGVSQRFLGFSPEMLGWIPADGALPLAVRARRPLLLADPASAASVAMGELARSISKRLKCGAGRDGRPSTGLIGAVTAWFSRSGTPCRAGVAGCLA